MAELESKTIKIDGEDIKLTPTFGLINDRAVAVLKDNIERAFGEVDFFLGRWVDDAYRRIALPQVMGTVEGALTTEQVAKNLMTELRRNGITGFVDRKGRRWRLDTYAIMVARTTTMEAHLIGSARRIAELGQDLVKVSTHLTDCPLCRPFEGAVLSLTGATEGYTTIAEARELGLFHPNCKHGFALYAEALLQEEAGEELEVADELEELKRSVNPLLADLVDSGYIKKDFAEFRRQIIEKFRELKNASRGADDSKIEQLRGEIIGMVRERYGLQLKIEAPRASLAVDNLDELIDGLFSAIEYLKNSGLLAETEKDGTLPIVELVRQERNDCSGYYVPRFHTIGFDLKMIQEEAKQYGDLPILIVWSYWPFYEFNDDLIDLVKEHSSFIVSFGVGMHEFGHAIFKQLYGNDDNTRYLDVLVDGFYKAAGEMLKKHYEKQVYGFQEWYESYAPYMESLSRDLLIGHKSWTATYALRVFGIAEYPSTALESYAFYLLLGKKLKLNRAKLAILNSAVKWATKFKAMIFGPEEEREVLESATPKEFASAMAGVCKDMMPSDFGYLYALFSLADRAGKLSEALTVLKSDYEEAYKNLLKMRRRIMRKVGKKLPEQLGYELNMPNGYRLAIDELAKKVKWRW